MTGLAPKTIPWTAAIALTVGATMAGWGASHAMERRLGAQDDAALPLEGVVLRQGVPLTEPLNLSFTFKTAAGRVLCSAPAVTVNPDSAGHFETAIPLGKCPSLRAETSSLLYDIRKDDELLSENQRLLPIPRALQADHKGMPDCPLGYVRDRTAEQMTWQVVCSRGRDEMVRVGAGASAFWIDRYEASIWDEPNGQGNRFCSYGERCPEWLVNVQDTAAPKLYAASVRGQLPGSGVTWFGANAVCRESGKRLPTGPEWLEAAARTPDPPWDPNESTHKCQLSGDSYAKTGVYTECVSLWGAENMVGSLAEYTTEWAVHVNTGRATNLGDVQHDWGPAWGSDGAWNVMGTTYHDTTTQSPKLSQGLPAVVLRGGAWTDGPLSGVFFYDTSTNPTYRARTTGFRCVIAR